MAGYASFNKSEKDDFVFGIINAEWIKKKSMIYCSNCASGWEAGYINDFNYCPNCGARMIRGE